MGLLPLEQIRSGLLRDPSLYPQNLSIPRRQFLLVRLSRPSLSAASFLDDRILGPEIDGRWIGLDEVEALLDGAKPARPLHFIFHSGHVGSTLISRLLDEVGGTLGLREPLPLRVLAEIFDEPGAAHALTSEPEAQRLLRWCCLLWSRGYADTAASVVKATSSAGRLSAPLLRIMPSACAVFVNVKAEAYLATLLAGENSPIDLRGHGSERHKRLARLGSPAPAPLHAMSLGELAALTWLAETLTQRRAQVDFGARMLTVDFDEFLAAPQSALRTICAHYGLSAAEAALARVEESPVLQRYSKAPEHPYTPTMRQEILADSRKRNAEDISKGLAWLDEMARRFPVVVDALSP